MTLTCLYFSFNSKKTRGQLQIVTLGTNNETTTKWELQSQGVFLESKLNFIELWFLPPYSPELNPVERLWKRMKQVMLHNRIYDSLFHLEEAIIQFFSELTTTETMKLCHCSYILVYNVESVLVCSCLHCHIIPISFSILLGMIWE